MKPGMLMHVTKRCQLITQHRISPSPTPHIDHTANQIRPFKGNPLPDTSPNAHQTDKVDGLHIQMV